MLSLVRIQKQEIFHFLIMAVKILYFNFYNNWYMPRKNRLRLKNLNIHKKN